MKVTALASVLAYRFGVEDREPLAPNHPSLGKVDSPQALADYGREARPQGGMRAAKSA